MLADETAPFVLLDDARQGGATARLYRHPVRVVETYDQAEVVPLLNMIRTSGLHAAGFLSYEAGAAFECAVATSAAGCAPLLWFGLFDTFEDVADVPALLPDPAGAWIGNPQPGIDRTTYDTQLAGVIDLIEAGDLYQANLTYRATAHFAGDPLAVYARLRGGASAGWGAIVRTGHDILLSFSPELFFALEGRNLTCRPMKGTARRAEDATADREAASTLATDPKQRAENLMIVDLMRNDLSRVAVAGSVAVPELFTVESYPTVHQLTSTVTAGLAPGRDAIDVLAAMFPCGSITGAPKIRAMQAIAAIERNARGPYTGAIGRIDAGGDAMFNVAIRTLLIQGSDTHATLGLGGGIVADSRADDEWDECAAKGAFVGAGGRRFDLIETMAFDPLAGLALLERHLARMKASAETFGFAFDRHTARNELQAATFRLRSAHRVRLLLAPSGAIAVEVGPLPPVPAGPVPVAIVALPVAPNDFRLVHKTSDRAFYDHARGTWFEVVFERADGSLTEGSYTSLFVERGDMLVTPPLTNGVLPGVLRAELIATGRAVEGELTRADLADGFFIGNAVRGLLPAILADPDLSRL